MTHVKYFQFCYLIPVLLIFVCTVCQGNDALRGHIQLTVDQHKISASILEAPLSKILSEMGKITSIKYIFNGEGANERVSVQFFSLSFQQALQQILKNNFVIISTTLTASPALGRNSLKSQAVIHILNRSPSTTSPNDLNRDVSSKNNDTSSVSNSDQSEIAKLAINAVESESADSRVQALDALTLKYTEEENRALVAQVFDKALADPEPKVRKAAFQIVTENAISISDGALIEVASNDSDPDIRLGSLYEIANRANPAVTGAILEKAQNDPDDRVSQAATQLLFSLRNKIPK
jgi:hypothetical protein